MTRLIFATSAAVLAMLTASEARTPYDGSWELRFITQRGACDQSTSFSVNITDGRVSHPNLVRLKGYVTRSGFVRASVTVQDKYASGSGKLSQNGGRGTWQGYS